MKQLFLFIGAFAAALSETAYKFANNESGDGDSTEKLPASGKRGPGRPPKSETVAEKEKPADPEPEADPPGTMTYDQLKDLIAPLMEADRNQEVTSVIQKYGPRLKDLEKKHHAAFKRDIQALLM